MIVEVCVCVCVCVELPYPLIRCLIRRVTILYRTLSCVACYGVSDSGITCLSSCPQLNDINISYCNKANQFILRICIYLCNIYR